MNECENNNDNTGTTDALLDDDGKTVFMLAIQNGATVEEATKMAKQQAKINKIKEKNSLLGQAKEVFMHYWKPFIAAFCLGAIGAVSAKWEAIIEIIKN